MSHLHCIQHEDLVAPGAVAEWCVANDVDLVVSRPDRGEALPQLRPGEPVVVLGGSPNLDQADRHPWISPERAWMRQLVSDPQARVLGICLGAQFLADALGGTVTDAPEPERGWLPIERGPDAELVPAFAQLEAPLDVFESHGQCCSLPPGASLLATGPGWQVQAFASSPTVIGVQFHPEFTPEIVQGVRANGTRWSGPFVQSGDDWLEQPGRFVGQHALLGQLLAWITPQSS